MHNAYRFRAYTGISPVLVSARVNLLPQQKYNQFNKVPTSYRLPGNHKIYLMLQASQNKIKDFSLRKCLSGYCAQH